MKFADVIAPLEVHRFAELYLPDRPFHREVGEIQFVESFGQVGLADAETLLREYPERVGLLRPDGSSVEVSEGLAALPYLHSGFTCYLRRVNKYLPQIAELVEDAAKALGVPTGYMTAEIFCSSGSSGVAMHSDYDINFALLLKGRKKWRIAANRSIKNQTSICLPSQGRQIDPTQLAYAHAPMPSRMPDDAVLLDVRAGGLVFLPTGWWHETDSQGDCIQLNLVVKGPHFAELFTCGLRKVLMSRPEWRAISLGLKSTTELGKERRDYFATMVREVADEMTRDPWAIISPLLEELSPSPFDTKAQNSESS